MPSVSDGKAVAAGKGRGGVEDDEDRMPQPSEASAQMAVRRMNPNLVLTINIDIPRLVEVRIAD